MKKLYQKCFLFIFILFITFVYTLFSPRKLTKSSIYTMSSSIYIDNPVPSIEPDEYLIDEEKLVYFSLKQETPTLIDHLNPGDENIIEESENKAVGNINGYVKYKKFGNRLEFFSNKGTLLAEIDSSGYPYLSENHPIVYVIKANGYGFSSFFIDGTPVLKEYLTNSLITSISCDKNLNTAISLADGSSLLIDKNGKSLAVLEQKNSKIKISKGSTIDQDSKYFAEISGISPEVFTLYDIQNHSILTQFETNGELRYTPLMKIHNDNVFYESTNKLILFQIKKKRVTQLSFKGEIKEFDVSEMNEIAILSTDKLLNYIYVYKPNGILVYYGDSYTPLSNIRYHDPNTFYFKKDNEIIVMRRKSVS